MAIWQGMLKALNLSKPYEIRQEDTQALGVFFERLIKAFLQYINIDPTDANNSCVVFGLFIGNSARDICKNLQKAEGLLGMPVPQILELARFIDKRETRRKGENIRVKKNCFRWFWVRLTPQGPIADPTGISRGNKALKKEHIPCPPPLKRNPCSFCKAIGHWRLECPPKTPQRTPNQSSWL